MSGMLASLLTENGLAARVADRFNVIIEASFDHDEVHATILLPARYRTLGEVKSRFNILIRWFKVMRGDLKWSIQRTLSALPHALRTELDGGKYEPPVRASW